MTSEPASATGWGLTGSTVGVNGPSLPALAGRLCETRLMPNFSIRLRLIFLSALLLAILAGSSALLIRELVRDSQSLTEEAKLVSIVKNANSASKHFGDLKYWAIDSAVTQLAASRQAAELAESGLDSDLKAISEVDPTVVEAIEGEVYIHDRSRAAGGRRLLERRQRSRQRSPGAGQRVGSWLLMTTSTGSWREFEQQALARRDASTRQAEFAVQLAIAGRNWSAGARVGLHRTDRSLDHRSPKAARSEHCFHHAWRTERRHAALRGRLRSPP